MRLPVRSASAIESDGRALTSTPVAEHQGGEEDAVADLGDLDLGQLVAGRGQQVLHQVVGQRARRDDALLGEGDRGRLDGADPDRQVALPRRLAQQHERLVRRHLHPDSDDIDLAHAVSLLSGAVGPRPQAAGQRRRRPVLTSAACSRTDSAASSAAVSAARAAALSSRLPRDRVDDLLDQPDLAVGGGLEGPDVPRLEPERGELGDRLRDDERVGVEVAGAADAAVSIPKSISSVELLVGQTRSRPAARRATSAGRWPEPARSRRRPRRRRPRARTAAPWPDSPATAGGSSPRSIASRCSLMTFSG